MRSVIRDILPLGRSPTTPSLMSPAISASSWLGAYPPDWAESAKMTCPVRSSGIM